MEVKIEKLDYEGRGLAHINGKVIFVKKALPEEIVDIKIEKDQKKHSVAAVNEFIIKRNDRVLSFCPYSKKCGGCTFDIVSYENSLKWKKEILKDLFSKNNILINEFEIVPSRPVLGYRNKVNLHVKNSQVGYYEEETHHFIPIQTCALLNPAIDDLIKDFDLYSFKDGDLTIRTNEQQELILHIESEKEPKIKESLIEKYKIVGICWNKKVVYGKKSLTEKRDSIEYQIPITSFFQINPYISEIIASDVFSFLKKEDTIFDLYSGVGFFSLRLSQYASKVIGIEADLQAVIAAEKNALKNNINNVSFHVGKVEDILEKIPISSKKVVVDPPRSGLHKKVINTFLKEEIETIYYISCNPITLVRDLNLLKEKYKITFFRAYDMFSYTKHVECVCVMTRR